MPSSEALHLVKALVLIQATARKLPDEKHPSSGKTSFSPPSKLKLLAAWATSIAGVASMVQRQPPDASILLTSMDHLSGSVIVVGSLSGKSLEFADPLIPQGRLHPADDILSYSTFPSCMDQMPCMQDLSGPAVSLGSSTPPYRVPAFQAYLTDGRCKKKNRIVASSTMGCTANRLLNTSSTLIRRMETTLSHLTHTHPSSISATITRQSQHSNGKQCATCPSPTVYFNATSDGPRIPWIGRSCLNVSGKPLSTGTAGEAGGRTVFSKAPAARTLAEVARHAQTVWVRLQENGGMVVKRMSEELDEAIEEFGKAKRLYHGAEETLLRDPSS